LYKVGKIKVKNLIVTVYAICKNEEKFVERWFNSMKEADNIVVLDTGSTDKTAEKLTNLGVKVTTKVISPWRFDTARNESLKLVPDNTDICVCTDLDEVFESGWCEKLKNSWQENTKQLRYTYVWNVLENNQDGITFLYEKIHALKDFKWVHPVHEIICYKSPLLPQEVATNKDIVLRHFPDPTKSRGQYLGLLELSVKEDPNSDRNMHYLSREYMFAGKYETAIKTFKKHLKMPNATWEEERSASYRYIGDCYVYLKKFKLAESYYKKAITTCFNIREPYLNLAQLYYNKKDYLNCIFVLNSMLNIKTKNLSYMTNPNCWNDYPYDLLSFCHFSIGNINLAIINTQVALSYNIDNVRLKNNLNFYLSLLKNNS